MKTMEDTDSMEMPVPCQKCGGWFDLTEGYGSEKWFPNTVICETCFHLEEQEIEIDEEIVECQDYISDAKITIQDNEKRLRQLGIIPIGNWISVKDKLPEFEEEVLCFQPSKIWAEYCETPPTKPRVIAGYLFQLESGKRDGYIASQIMGIKDCPLIAGGTFWAFPYICHQNFVTHWQPLPQHPL